MVNTRVTLRRSHSYATRSNNIRKVRTPGGKLVAQHVPKRASGVKCSCGKLLQGVW